MKNQKQQGTSHNNLEIITNRRIEKMSILDSEKHIRLLQDFETGFYVVFNGRLNQSFYSKSYQMAEKRFNHLVTLS